MTKKTYQQLNEAERHAIALGLQQKLSLSAIARALGLQQKHHQPGVLSQWRGQRLRLQVRPAALRPVSHPCTP